MIIRNACAVNPQACRMAVAFSISDPLPEDKGFYSVQLHLVGIEAEARAILAADGWQAVMMAMQTCRMVLLDLQNKGWQFIWHKDDDRYDDVALKAVDMYTDYAE